MNLIRLAWSYLKSKPLNTGLNIILLSSGIAVITTLIIFSHQFAEKTTSNSKGIDLVVGAKGSPLQLVLCNVFHIDFPTGNIKLYEAEALASNRMVKKAIPLALGDSYNNFRIIGTDTAYAHLLGVELEQGKWWSEDLEVVAGASVARALQLKLGDTFVSAHGLTDEGDDHQENHYVVVGILAPAQNVADNLLFTNIPSIWRVHQPHEKDSTGQEIHSDILRPSKLVAGADAADSTREITSMLIRYRNPIAALQLPRMINGNTKMQAASPAFESARLYSIVGVGVDVLVGIAATIIFMSALSIFIALYNSLKERRYDMAIMRSMGARRGKLFALVILESVFLTGLGSGIGIVFGHLVVTAFTAWVPAGAQTGFTGSVFYSTEIWLWGASLALGVVCAIIPAVQAYRTDIHKVLSGN